ncbi:SDR family NAD(P)-dependent oxidoreductase [Phenylobacterium sp.]|jgi:NAD(P)-dependent dehydrogenase (short-subunit alcohol dehydrogenase family)|uniref:SDR family NAD(P)-dependent oxidoreductase n=1 Tax=Phenylobacterium sp. TaxID=1871053 RepID=UPI002F417D02
MRRHEGKVALCAGSATGMGAETALRLGREGARVVVGDVNLDAAQKLVDRMVSEGGEGLAITFDIADPDSVKALVDRTVERFGKLDLMHVNATDRKLNLQDYDAVTTDLEVFDRMHAVSLRGHLLCTRFAVPEMLKAGGGAIVYTSSDAGKTSAPQRMSYYIAKAGLNGLMRHTAIRWGKEGVRANCICPGVILTDAVLVNTTEEFREQQRRRVPSPRLGTMQDIAALVAFLLSDEAGWINGQAVSVDGGSVMHG